jgi:hypothetical protein
MWSREERVGEFNLKASVFWALTSCTHVQTFMRNALPAPTVPKVKPSLKQAFCACLTSTLKMDSEHSSEMLENLYRTTLRDIPGDSGRLCPWVEHRNSVCALRFHWEAQNLERTLFLGNNEASFGIACPVLLCIPCESHSEILPFQS